MLKSCCTQFYKHCFIMFYSAFKHRVNFVIINARIAGNRGDCFVSYKTTRWKLHLYEPELMDENVLFYNISTQLFIAI